MRPSFFVAAAALFLNCLMFVFVIKEPPAPPSMAADEPPEPERALPAADLAQEFVRAGVADAVACASIADGVHRARTEASPGGRWPAWRFSFYRWE